jgi:hypothetical protein
MLPTDGHNQLAVWRVLLDAVLVVVDGPNEPVGRGVDIVGAVVELAVPPVANQVATGVENQHRMCASAQDIDFVVGVYRDPRNVHQLPAFGDFRQILRRGT